MEFIPWVVNHPPELLLGVASRPTANLRDGIFGKNILSYFIPEGIIYSLHFLEEYLFLILGE
jgi:hypothetical protein